MKRSKFSLSHYRLTTAKMGQLVPLTWFDVLPSDSIQHSTQLLVRLNPMMAPIMHPIRVRIHHWFVPYRILVNDFEDFITGGEDGTYESQPPTATLNAPLNVGTLGDHLGFPTGDYTSNNAIASAFPARAYSMIWNDFYRDEQLDVERIVNDTPGADAQALADMFDDPAYVAWEKDMFTSARPQPALGDEIYLPIGESAPLRSTSSTEDPLGYWSPATEAGAPSGTPLDWQNEIYADLSQATGITVRELREYLALQRYQENRNRYGARYDEYLAAAFGVNPQDSRLQQPEYLGGGRTQLSISEILQTQRTDTGESPLGTMAGHGIGAVRTNRYRRFIPEHGLVMTLLSVVPKSIYMNAVPRKWHRMNKEMFFQKELQFIGEEEITNREVYSLHSDPTGVFGYADRYDSYKFEPSSVSGEFRTVNNYWHLARDFASDVALNSDFIKCVPTMRVFADQTSDPLLVMANHSIQARRPVAKWANPKTF